MRILGIDPGTAIVGYGVIDREYSNYTTIDYGCIRTPATEIMDKRLCMIYDSMCLLLKKFEPDQVAIEELFFNRNVTTAITVGQARGVIILACAQNNIPVAEYTPLQVKQAIAGYGKAEKRQVQYMIKNTLGLREIPKPDDAADALAIAICHSNWLSSHNWENNNLK